MAAIVVFVTVCGSIHSSEQTGIAAMGRSNIAAMGRSNSSSKSAVPAIQSQSN